MTDPLLVIHPFPMDARFWEPMTAALGTARQVLSYELPGFGAAPSEPGWSIHGAAGSIANHIAAETPNGRAVVAGLSMGGYAALALVSHAPDRVAALVLADTRAEADTPAAREGRAEAIAALREYGSGPFLTDFLPNLLSPAASDRVRQRVREIASDQGAETLIGALEALRDRPERTGELTKIRVPTLVLVGEDDAVTPRIAAETMVNGIPGAELVVIPGAGHLSAIEQPTAFAAALDRFLGSL